MANPRIVNSSNIIQFGFSATFNLELRQIVFDTAALTQYVSGNAVNVQGIYFDVFDASGMQVATADFTNPDIDPSAPAPFVVQLANGFAQWGLFVIRGIIRDQDGTDYTIELKKDICLPEDFSNGVVKGKLSEVVNCDAPKIIITENSKLYYQGKKPILIEKDGDFYYPSGTLLDIGFAFTPFEVTDVYTGSYTVKNKTTATYDLGDNVYVEIAYKSTLQFDVTCQSQMVNLLCCVKEVQDQYINDPNSARGRNAKLLIDKINLPFLTAVIKEKAGQDASVEIKSITDILGCDCNCGDLIEPRIITSGVSSANVTVVGAGGATVTQSTVGSTTQYSVSSKTSSVTKDPSDLSFNIQAIVSGVNTEYKITFNNEERANAILTTIDNDVQLTQYLQDIVGATNTGISLAGFDGGCVMDVADCGYLLVESTTVSKIINSITINGTVNNAPTGLSITNAVAIASWLNGLSLGVFTVSYNAGSNTTTIQSLDNPANITQLTITSQGNTIVRQFIKTCVGLVEVLNAIVEYICDLQANQITYGVTGSSLCSYDGGGNLVTTTVSPTVKLDALLTSILTSQCQLFNRLVNAGVTCAAMKTLFTTNANAFVGTDGVYGLKGDTCAKITMADLAAVQLSTISGNSGLKAAFCAIVASCTAPTCSAPTNVSGVLTTGPTCVSITNIVATASA